MIAKSSEQNETVLGSERERIVIAVLTYRRPNDLTELLPKLVDQALHTTDPHRLIEILVIDNDDDAGAKPAVRLAAQQAAHQSVQIRYAHEPTPGISAARNRALDETGSDDVLIFIDDDERPSPEWLRHLLRARERYAADVVQGPVASRFEVPPENWLIAGGFFSRRRMPTGTRLDVAVTNNLLLDLHVVRSIGVRFDLELGTTGGEDTLFTRLLHRAGVPMVWCAEAVVFDVVPSHRATRGWARQRAISTGNAAAVVTLKLAPDDMRRTFARVGLTCRGILRIAAGGVRLGVGWTTGSESMQGAGSRTLLRGVGMTVGAWGYAYHEYAREGARRLTRVGSSGSTSPSVQSALEVDHVS